METEIWSPALREGLCAGISGDKDVTDGFRYLSSSDFLGTLVSLLFQISMKARVPEPKELKKPKRIRLACANCRNRKVKCDGQLPQCATCVRRKETCIYRKMYKAAVPNVYVKYLEEKLGIAQPPGISGHDAEPYMDAPNSNENTQTSPDTDVLSMASLHSSHPGDRRNSVPGSTSSLWKILDHEAGPETEASQKESQHFTVDAMGAASSDQVIQNQEFYGNLSAMSFLRSLLSNFNVEQTVEIEKTPRPKPEYIAGRNFAKSSSSDWILPVRRVANKYVDIYFRDAFPLYPFLHKPTFLKAYEGVWNDDNSGGDDDLFYCVINLIFAFGVLHEHSNTVSQDVPLKADVFYKRCESKLTSEAMSHGSVLLLQVLLLKSQFLQATPRASECWNTIGLSVRVAQSLGIHLDQVISAKESFIEREVCKRLWTGCVMMDVVSSMTFGRPLMGTCNFPVELPSDANDDLITDEGVDINTNDLSQGAFFIESLKLYRILERILTSCYSPTIKSFNSSAFVDLFSIEESLQAFELNLPFHLKPESKTLHVAFQRQATILKVRFLHVQIMLYRAPLMSQRFGPRLSKICRNFESSSFDSCLEVTVELIDILKTNFNRVPSVLPAPWYQVFYLYTCAIVLLMAKIKSQSEKLKDGYQIESAWIDCVSTLRKLLAGSESATRCLQCFESLNEKIWQSDHDSSNPVFDHDALLPFAYSYSNIFQAEFQFPG